MVVSISYYININMEIELRFHFWESQWIEMILYVNFFYSIPGMLSCEFTAHWGGCSTPHPQGLHEQALLVFHWFLRFFCYQIPGIFYLVNHQYIGIDVPTHPHLFFTCSGNEKNFQLPLVAKNWESVVFGHKWFHNKIHGMVGLHSA